MANISKEYKSWLNELKQRIHSSQIKAALKVDGELLALYWHLGSEILEKGKEKGYGKKLIDQLSKYLMHEFPQVKGFSKSNLYYIRQWASFYAQKRPIVQQVVGQLADSGQLVDNENNRNVDNAILKVLFQIPFQSHLKCT
jgi:hypothetical protein